MPGKNLFAEEQSASPKGRNLFAEDQATIDQPAQAAPVETKPDYGIVGNTVMELANAINRGGADFVDFFVSDPINAASQLVGSDARAPTLEKAGEDAGITQGNFMEPGLAKDIVRTTGEILPSSVVGGAVLRSAATLANPLIKGANEVRSAGIAAEQLNKSGLNKVLQQVGAGSTKGDIAFTALSGAGSEVGEELGGDPGKIVGAFLAPVAGQGAKTSLTSLIKAGKSGFQSLMQPLAAMSDDGASTLLAEAMVREGLSPDDVAKRLAELGPEALPADAGINFSRLLRTAANKIPRIEGLSATVLNARQAGQGNRLLSALDDATGTASLSLDDEIVRIETVMKPEITRLYNITKSKPLPLSGKLRAMFEGENSVSRAMKLAQRRLADKRAAGDKISNVDMIDATKQVMDDQIGVALRKGENNKVRDLVRLKNIMVEEADTAIPEYGEARSLFAGKASLENAANAGEMFVKMKPRDMANLTKSYGESEMRMFKLGAKQAVLDKIDDIQVNADAVKRLFGKNGDVKKLRGLFDTNQQFNQFSNTLKREADFVLTRRAAQANSTTAKQLADSDSAFSVLQDAANAVSTPQGAVSTVNRIVSGLSKNKNDKIYTKALEEVGDILLTRDIDPEVIQRLLVKGTAKQIEARLRASIAKEIKHPYAAASIVGGVSELDNSEN